MKIQIYTIKDKKSETFGQPYLSQNNVTAIRTLGQDVNNASPSNVLYTNPEDFELYHTGSFDTETGVLEPAPTTKIMNADKLVKETN